MHSLVPRRARRPRRLASPYAFTFEQLLLNYHTRTRASMAPALAGMEAVDDSTVILVVAGCKHTLRETHCPPPIAA